jgi:hypothetical protein
LRVASSALAEKPRGSKRPMGAKAPGMVSMENAATEEAPKAKIAIIDFIMLLVCWGRVKDFFAGINYENAKDHKSFKPIRQTSFNVVVLSYVNHLTRNVRTRSTRIAPANVFAFGFRRRAYKDLACRWTMTQIRNAERSA